MCIRDSNFTAAVNTTSSTGALTISTGNAALIVDNTGGTSTTLGFGSLARSNNATFTLKGITTDIGTAGNEKISFTSAPAVLNGTIGTWAVIQGAGANNAGTYATMSGSNVVAATYGGTGDLDLAAGSTQLFDATGVGGSLTADRSVYAFRTDSDLSLIHI